MNPSSAKIFEFPEIRMVEASAGSGKTYALAQRYVQLLFHPSFVADPRNFQTLLAVTFTNKAAFAMKARILQLLKRIAFQDLSPVEEKDILRSIGLSQVQASKIAFQMMESIIHHYHYFQVQTIDKLINSFLLGCAFKLGLTTHFQIRNNAIVYLEQALDSVIDQAQHQEPLQKLFRHFLHNYLYLENRGNWFPKKDILAILYSLNQLKNVYAHDFKRSPFAPEDLIKKKRLILSAMKKLFDQLPEETNASFRKGIEQFLKKHEQSFDIDSVSDYFARSEIPLRKDAKVPSELDRLWAQIHQHLIELCEEEAVSLFDPYLGIFEPVHQSLLQICMKEDVVFLDELNRKARLLFEQGQLSVEELYFRLATRFRHYLWDEFQDTSRLQWKNLYPLIEESLAAAGSLYYVGDRKQAIYDFRGGDARLFDEVTESFSSTQLHREVLVKNWRSQKAVVEFNNQIFSIINLKRFIQEKTNHEESKNRSASAIQFNETDFKRLEQVFQHAQQEVHQEKLDGYVQFEFIDIANKDERDEVIHEKLLGLVKDLHQRYVYQDMAVLTRSHAESEQVTHWLLTQGIAVDSERTSSIRENSIILELIDFLKFLDSPIDNAAFISFIGGEIFASVTQQTKEFWHDFIFQLRERSRQKESFYHYTEFRQQFPKLWEAYFDEYFRNIGLYPLYEMIVSIYHRLGVLQRFPGDQGFLMRFLELIKEQEQEHADISSFLKYFEGLDGEELYVRITDRDAVKVLTIHKAKGLEFPVVILPFLGMKVQVGSRTEQQYSYVTVSDGQQIQLLRLKEKYYKFSDRLSRIYRQQYLDALFIELNNVYVALTRPQEELYAFIPQRTGQNLNFLKFLIPPSWFRHGQPGTAIFKSKEAKAELIKIPQAQYHDWMEFLRDEFVSAGELKNRRQRLHGQHMHALLAFIGNLHDRPLIEILQELKAQADLQFSETDIIDPVMDRIKNFLQDSRVKPFFDLAEGQVFCEQEIVNSYGHTKRPDRIIVGAKDVLVIDFKWSLDQQGRNQAQVLEYMKILAELYPQRTIKGFLVYLDSFDVEAVHE